jgi:DNA-directed RNA polymerase specialized sigma24 family protein
MLAVREANRRMYLSEHRSREQEMIDLFDWTPEPGYPHAAGWKEPTTSRDAATKVAPLAKTLRDQVLVTLRVVWPEGLTADEVAEKMGRREISVRPRLTELRHLRAIEPRTTKGVVDRRNNPSGMSAIVWVARRAYGDWT